MQHTYLKFFIFIFTKYFTHLICLSFPIKRYYQIVFAISSCPVVFTIARYLSLQKQ